MWNSSNKWSSSAGWISLKCWTCIPLTVKTEQSESVLSPSGLKKEKILCINVMERFCFLSVTLKSQYQFRVLSFLLLLAVRFIIFNFYTNWKNLYVRKGSLRSKTQKTASNKYTWHEKCIKSDVMIRSSIFQRGFTTSLGLFLDVL